MFPLISLQHVRIPSQSYCLHVDYLKASQWGQRRMGATPYISLLLCLYHSMMQGHSWWFCVYLIFAPWKKAQKFHIVFRGFLYTFQGAKWADQLSPHYSGQKCDSLTSDSWWSTNHLLFQASGPYRIAQHSPLNFLKISIQVFLSTLQPFLLVSIVYT